MSRFIDDMQAFAAAVEALAFKIPAPNEYTPRLVQMSQAAKAIISLERQAQKRRYRQLLSIDEFFRDGIDYGEGLQLVAVVKDEIKSIVEQAFTHPELRKR